MSSSASEKDLRSLDEDSGHDSIDDPYSSPAEDRERIEHLETVVTWIRQEVVSRACDNLYTNVSTTVYLYLHVHVMLLASCMLMFVCAISLFILTNVLEHQLCKDSHCCCVHILLHTTSVVPIHRD